MTILQRYKLNDIELIVDHKTGEVFATQGMIGKLCCQESSTIRYFLEKRGEGIKPQVALVKDSRGVEQDSKLYDEEAIYQSFAKYNPDLLVKCAKAGIRVYLHRLAGYEVKSTAVEQDFKLPQTYLEALEELVAKERENVALKEHNDLLTLKIVEDQHKVSLAECLEFCEDSIEFGEFAKIIGTGRTRLFRKMRDCGVIMKLSTLPYQRWIDAGYFEVSQEITPNGKTIPFALVTGKGQLWLKQRLDEFESIEKRAIAGIASGVFRMG